MQNLVDSCGWIEYFTDGENADFFAPVLEDVDSLIVPTVCMLEVAKVVFKKHGKEAVDTVISAMSRGTVVDLSVNIALLAAEFGAHHKLPLADSVIYATARFNDATLWTQDNHLEGLHRVEYVKKN